MSILTGNSKLIPDWRWK